MRWRTFKEPKIYYCLINHIFPLFLNDAFYADQCSKIKLKIILKSISFSNKRMQLTFIRAISIFSSFVHRKRSHDNDFWWESKLTHRNPEKASILFY